jgi:hypothetical protein
MSASSSFIVKNLASILLRNLFELMWSIFDWTRILNSRSQFALRLQLRPKMEKLQTSCAKRHGEFSTLIHKGAIKSHEA